MCTHSADVWLGKESLDLGLIDGIGDVREVMRQKFGDDVVFRYGVAWPQSLFKLGSFSPPRPFQANCSRAVLTMAAEFDAVLSGCASPKWACSAGSGKSY